MGSNSIIWMPKGIFHNGHLPFHKGVNSRRTQLQKVLDIFDPNVNFTRGRILGTCHAVQQKALMTDPAIASKAMSFLSGTQGSSDTTSLHTTPLELCSVGHHSAMITVAGGSWHNLPVMHWCRKGEGTTGETQPSACPKVRGAVCCCYGITIPHRAHDSWRVLACWALPLCTISQ